MSQKSNYAMPVKNGLYDFLQLSRQVTETAKSHKRSDKNTISPTYDEYLSGRRKLIYALRFRKLRKREDLKVKS